MTQQEWRAFVTWRRSTTPTTFQLNTMSRALPGFGVVIYDGARYLTAALTVEAGAIRLACEAAVRAARLAHGAALNVAGEPVAVRVLTLEEYEAEVARPRPMELVGLSEAAELLDISPQRVDQLARENPRFPAPVARLAAGAVFTKASIEAAREAGWQRPPGRPRRSG